METTTNNITFAPTGSISQDALRLGFQPTCNKGIAKLLKVDDITVEECSKFLDRHLIELQEYLSNVKDIIAKREMSDFNDNVGMNYSLYKYNANVWCPNWVSALMYPFAWYFKFSKSIKRVCKVTIDKISKPNIKVTGVIESTINLIVSWDAWEGYQGGKYRIYDAISNNTEVKFRTDAKRCTVKYIDYDEYHDRYIPDEAAAIAKQALDIGMTDISVAVPIINDVNTSDPIIVGQVGSQMFILAWFGYDKNNHMSCNM